MWWCPTLNGLRWFWQVVLAINATGLARPCASSDWWAGVGRTCPWGVGGGGPVGGATVGGAGRLDAVLGVWALTRTARVAGRRVIAIDGKTVRGARGGGFAGSHLVAALAHGSGAVLGQVAVSEKSNEIPTARELLELLDLDGVVVTMDALHTQHDTAALVTRAGGRLCPDREGESEVVVRTAQGAPLDFDTRRHRDGPRTWTPRHSHDQGRDVPAWVEFAGAGQVAQLRRTVTARARPSQTAGQRAASAPVPGQAAGRPRSGPGRAVPAPCARPPLRWGERVWGRSRAAWRARRGALAAVGRVCRAGRGRRGRVAQVAGRDSQPRVVSGVVLVTRHVLWRREALRLCAASAWGRPRPSEDGAVGQRVRGTAGSGVPRRHCAAAVVLLAHRAPPLPGPPLLL
ncbi:ISAs1 family transposase [Streptomyces sp. NPDC085932]|uniref:ISAs1 family transposase n=1 Tax=Streptomyces sp. NPDC085932 TaxID=3365741 RepID=UPI0037D7D55B